MQKKTYTILGKDVTVEFDDRVFRWEGKDLMPNYGGFPYNGDIQPIEDERITGSINTPYGVINSDVNQKDLENWVCSVILNHMQFEGKKSLAGLSNFLGLFSCTSIVEFSKKAFPLLTFDGVDDLSCLFRFCKNIKIANLSGLYSSSITGISDMFYACQELERVDFSGWDFSNVECDNVIECGETICPILNTVVLRDCKGDLSSIINSIVNNAIVRDIAHTYFTSVEELENSNIGTRLVDAEGLLSGSHRSDVTTIIVSSNRYSEVCNIVENAYDLSIRSSKFKLYRHNGCFPDEETYRKLVRVALPNGETDSETTAFLVEEIREKFRDGMSERAIYSSLREAGRSDYEIVCAMADIGESYSTEKPGNDLVSAYCKKVVIPQITKVLHPGSTITVGQVVEELYKKYPRNLVNQAMVLYTWEMCPSIVE